MNIVQYALLLVCLVCKSNGHISEGFTDEDYIICKRRAAHTRNVDEPMDYSEEAIEWICIQNILRPMVRTGYTLNTLTEQQTLWLETITVKVMKHASSSSKGNRVRQEYRTLSQTAKEKFHDAIAKLHTDFYKYSALVKLYAGESGDLAHTSPAFLPWHRIYLLLFEEALREYDSSVTVPYWDSSLDSYLDDATKSSLWSDHFLGNGRGFVTTGPFANWTTTEGTLLLRNVGEAGRLITPVDIGNVFSQSFMGGISYPGGNFKSNLETLHGAVQLWVGGDMAQLTLAPNDPAFFLNLAFIDLLWEEFRQNQLKMTGTQRVNPYTDWPDSSNPLHNAQRQIGIIPETPNIMGLSSRFGSHIYTYTARLSCSAENRACGSTRYIRCSSKLGVCIPVMSLQTFTNARGMDGIQNTYCINKICDIDEWVYLPIGVIHNRPQNYEKYGSYPVQNALPDYTNDIYSSSVFSQKSWFSVKYNAQARTPEYLDCNGKGRMMKDKLNIVSYGLTYDGTYRDYIVIDKRMSIFPSIGFIALKRPRTQGSEAVRAMIRVYDECGRLCRPACHIQGSKHYSSCSGIVKITPQFPVTYFNSLHEAMDSLWNYTRNYTLPIRTNNMLHYPFLRFYCEFDGMFPWFQYDFIQATDRPEVDLPPLDKYRTLWKWNVTVPTPIDATIDSVNPVDEEPSTTTPVTTPTTTTTTTSTTTAASTTTLSSTIPSECYVRGDCYNKKNLGPCTPCAANEFRPCPDIYHKYLHCAEDNGWKIKLCPQGLYFSCRYPTCDWWFFVTADPLCAKVTVASTRSTTTMTTTQPDIID